MSGEVLPWKTATASADFHEPREPAIHDDELSCCVCFLGFLIQEHEVMSPLFCFYSFIRVADDNSSQDDLGALRVDNESLMRAALRCPRVISGDLHTQA